VIISDVMADAAVQTAREFEAAGHKAVAMPCDVTRPDEVERLAAKIVETFGKWDILVNNAGITAMAWPFG